MLLGHFTKPLRNKPKQILMKKIIITYGLIAGLITMSFMIASTILVNHDIDMNLCMLIGFTGMFIAFIFVFIGIKSYRDKYNNGVVSFGDAFKIGLSIALIASCIYTLVWLIEFHFFFPDFMDKFSAKAIEDIRASTDLKASEMSAKIAEMETMRENYKNILYRILYTMMEILPIGIVIALVSALILKRKRKLA